MSVLGERGRRPLAVVWLLVGAAMVAVPVWLGITRWEAVLSGHPVTLATVLATGLLGFVALACAVATLAVPDRWDSEERPRTPRQKVRRDSRRIALAVPTLALCLAATGLLAWSRPMVAVEPALTAARTGDGVRVADRLTWYEMTPGDPQAERPTTALVFTPGARVDPRAYAHVLRPLAAAGYLVVVLKEPFGVSFLDGQHAERAMEAHPEVTRWVVGGHSLGGVTAAAFAGEHTSVGTAPVVGLVLWASYPAGAVTRSGLAVTSVSGQLDGLTTPADIAASVDDLPADTRFVEVPGAVHSSFGDYGLQPGDGATGADRTEAQSAITAATQELLAAVTPAEPDR